MGESWACPWSQEDIKAAQRRGTVAVLRSMTEKVRLHNVLIQCCGAVHETWVPTEWHRKLYHSQGCTNARALPEGEERERGEDERSGAVSSPVTHVSAQLKGLTEGNTCFSFNGERLKTDVVEA